MPLPSVFFVRSSLLYLLVGFSLGALILWQKASIMPPEVWQYLPLHLELLTFGWIVQLVFGVAYWILPRFANAPVRGREILIWTSFVSLNAGIWLIGLQAWLPSSEWWALGGRSLQLLAVLCFALNSWRRIKPFGV